MPAFKLPFYSSRRNKILQKTSLKSLCRHRLPGYLPHNLCLLLHVPGSCQILFLFVNFFFLYHPNLSATRSLFSGRYSSSDIFFAAFKLGFNIGNDACLHQLAFTELRFRVEYADAVDLVAKQLHAVRFSLPKE